MAVTVHFAAQVSGDRKNTCPSHLLQGIARPRYIACADPCTCL